MEGGSGAGTMPPMSELTDEETVVDSPAQDVGNAPPKVVLLVDGSSYLYRAFHAMPDLRAVPGDPTSPATGAIRGMISATGQRVWNVFRF